MSDLEESIERVGRILALTPSMHEVLKKALRAFAAAIQRERFLDHPTEPKDSRGCAEFCNCGKQPTPELPEEVREKIKEIMEGTSVYGQSLVKLDGWLRYGGGFQTILEDLAHLCLSMRAK